MKPVSLFPPSPRSFRGRTPELRTLLPLVQTDGARIALVGAGGSGKSALACVLGHRASRFFGGRIHWFRIGAWDARTLVAMMALRFGVRGHGRHLARSLRRFLIDTGPTLIVLDNHEDDAATAELLDGLRGARVSWVITARRCLLSGVTVFPVVPPLVTVGKSPFPRVAALTRPLRWNPVALDLADALVAAGATSAEGLAGWLRSKGIHRVRPVEHEDDLPEVALLVERAWRQLPQASRRMLGVLAHMGGDHMDSGSLAELAGAGSRPAEALGRLVELRLVQEPMRGRFTLHATVRHAVQKRTAAMPGRLFEHYVGLVERDPARAEVEQSHLFAAMDHAQEACDMGMILRAERAADALSTDHDGE